MTEQVLTPEPLSVLCTKAVHRGFTQTAAKRYFTASSQTVRMSSREASGFSRVWSMTEAIDVGS